MTAVSVQAPPLLPVIMPADSPDEVLPRQAEAEDMFKREKFELDDASHVQDVSEQCLADSEGKKPGKAVRFFARVFGQSAMRRLSNFGERLGASPKLEARRDYAVLPPHALLRTAQNKPLLLDGKPVSASELAVRYYPIFKTTRVQDASDPKLTPNEIRYEVLPPKAGYQNYSIIYYFARDSENMPIPVISSMYDWARKILFGTQRDWEVVQIDVNRDTGQPEALVFETSNYGDDPNSYDTVQARNLHLRAKISRQPKGNWQHTVFQKNGQSKSVEVDDPFAAGNHPSMVIVAWNGSVDVETSLKRKGIQQISEFVSPAKLAFLDIETFRREGMDLRATWVKGRKSGQCVLWMPARKPDLAPQKLSLVSE